LTIALHASGDLLINGELYFNKMAKYCDSKKLERDWTLWLLATENEKLEPLRGYGKLWTRRREKGLEHCIASIHPFKFRSSGTINSVSLEKAIRSSFYPLDASLMQKLEESNYYHEIPTDESWNRLTSTIYEICRGVSLNFRPPTEDIKNELIHEAYLCILGKIERGKLKFEPGKAPVFNLLTTAIFRVMYSIKNKEKRKRERQSELIRKLQDGAPPKNLSASIYQNDH
jgi:hypothetical protein